MIIFPLETSFIYHGKTIHLDLSFNRVLAAQRTPGEELLTNEEKDAAVISLLIKNKRVFKRFSTEEQAEILEITYKKFIISQDYKPESKDELPHYDFYQDEQLIYSSFLLDYGIDLIEQRNKLDWREFIALFQGLSDRTKMREVISIRQRKIPEATKYNADEIEALQEAKRYYALTYSDEQLAKIFNKNLDNFGRGLEMAAKQAQKGGANHVRR